MINKLIYKVDDKVFVILNNKEIINTIIDRVRVETFKPHACINCTEDESRVRESGERIQYFVQIGQKGNSQFFDWFDEYKVSDDIEVLKNKL